MLKKSNKNSEKQDEDLARTLKKKHKKIIMQRKNNKKKDSEATLFVQMHRARTTNTKYSRVTMMMHNENDNA
jgi:hypothetical protein